MPELPEVELVAASLNRLVGGRKIVFAELLRDRLAPFDAPPEFSRKLKNSFINRVHRRGKHILFDLDTGRTLIAHLRMTGRFLLLAPERELPKHTHAVFYLGGGGGGSDDEARLAFQDQRHFGLMKIVETAQLHEAAELKKLAPEPFSEDFTPRYLRETLAKSKKPLKELLLDQTKVCGLGNIYVSESLYRARINPQLAANRLSAKKTQVLFAQIREVLAESIRHGSTMNVNPEDIDASYYGGEYEGHWRVYDQEKKPCLNCRTQIRRIVQAGRSTYFCPKCQR